MAEDLGGESFYLILHSHADGTACERSRGEAWVPA